MYTKQSKKFLILNIIDILQKYTDEDHKLSQKEIEDILRTEYDMTVDRKSVKRNIQDLIECGYPIGYTESFRKIPIKDSKTGKYLIDSITNERKLEEICIWSDFYLEGEFTNGEIRLLIDSLLFARHIPYAQCKSLIQKLENLSGCHTRFKTTHISRMPDGNEVNQQLFLNIELLDEAISKNRKISFQYLEYGTDKKLYPKKRPDGSIREYIISPYQMAAKEGKYYLICNYDKYDDISNYRIDRIKNITILEETVKPFESLRWSDGKALNLTEYMKEHIYMYSSGRTRVKFRITRPMISDIIDMFGADIRFTDEDETRVTVTANTNELAMLQFAKRYGPDVEVLEPKGLRNKIREELEKALEVYK